MLPHPLTNFEIRKYYQRESKFNGVYSRNNLPKKNNGAYATNPDEYKSVGTHWILLHVNGDNRSKTHHGTYFGNFRVESVPKEITKIHRKQKYHNKYL